MASQIASSLSNEELREALHNKGLDIGPITHSTRKLYEKKLVQYVEKAQSLSDSNGSVVENNGLVNGGDIRRSSTPEALHQNGIRRSGSPASIPPSPNKILQNGEDIISNDLNTVDTNGHNAHENSLNLVLEDEGSDDDSSSNGDEFETSRLLSNDEAEKFRSKLFASTSNNTSGLNSTRTNKVSTRNAISAITNKYAIVKVGAIVIGFVVTGFIVAALLLYFGGYMPENVGTGKDEH